MRSSFKVVLIACLVALHLSVVYAALHPKVNRAYRAYFIDRTTTDWAVPHYAATFAQGIDLTKPGLPDFVASSYGIASRESFGAWTDTTLGTHAGFVLNRPVAGPVCLQMLLGASDSSLNHPVTLRLGSQEKQLQIDHRAQYEYTVDFPENGSAEVIEFVFPHRLPRASVQDWRQVGISIGHIRFLPSPCPVAR
jgi:hypothetical protein